MSSFCATYWFIALQLQINLSKSALWKHSFTGSTMPGLVSRGRWRVTASRREPGLAPAPQVAGGSGRTSDWCSTCHTARTRDPSANNINPLSRAPPQGQILPLILSHQSRWLKTFQHILNYMKMVTASHLLWYPISLHSAWHVDGALCNEWQTTQVLKFSHF